MADDLKNSIATTAFAFRGYNITNLGKSPQLLKHPVYGAIVEQHLTEASEICSAAIKRDVNLVGRVRRRAKTTLRSYAQDLSMIVALELAQLKLLEEFFGVKYNEAQLSLGYSLGEIAAVVAGGVFNMQAALHPLLVLAKDAAALAMDVQMGVLFSRGPALDVNAVERLCLHLTSEGQGVISISTYLSPNTLLLMGQGVTLDRFKERMHDVFPKPVHLRKNSNHWPPIHTPITRQRNISNRASVILDTVPGGFTVPEPPILSCVTGDAGYDDRNSRAILACWVDHPQLLWDVIDKTLASGVDTLIHVGPEPNIIPATFNRLSNNVTAQLSGRSLASMGMRAMSHFARRRPWLTSVISSDAPLLRAPFIEHIFLEDWLLEQEVE